MPSASHTSFLIVGASGLVGGRLLRALGPGQALGTYASRPFPGGVRFDLGSDRLSGLLHGTGRTFTHAVIPGAMTHIDDCARDPEGSARVNVTGTCRLLDDLMSAGIHPVFVSSDGVYPGDRPMATESDDLRPVLTYGWQKRAVEEHLEARPGPWTVVRLAKVLDPELDPQGVLGPWIDQLASGRKIRCATDQWFSPVGVDDVVTAILRLAEGAVQGIFNLAGAQRVSRIELLRMLVEAVGRDTIQPPDIEPCGIGDFPFAEPRAPDGSMAIGRLRSAIAFEPASLEDLCRRAAARHRFVREVPAQASLQASPACVPDPRWSDSCRL